MRILILSFEYPPRAGAGTHVFELARGLSRAEHDISILAVTPAQSRTYQDGGIDVHLVAPSPETCAAVSHLSPPQGVLAVCQDLIHYGKWLLTRERKRPDVIHCHDWYTYPAARELGFRFGIPVVGTAHSTSEPIVRWWGELPDEKVVEQELALYHKADGLITVSESMKRLIGQTHGVSADRITVIHNGLDWRVFAQPELSPAQLQSLRQKVAPGGERVILFAGRLTAQKGITALLESAAQVLTAEEQVRYLVVGEADSLASAQVVETLRRQHQPLGARLQLLGRLARKQLSLLYQVADVAVVSSLYEPFGYAAVEAMAAGVAVVATAVGGLPEIIEHERSGLLVPVQPTATGAQQVDVAALAQAQLRLLRDEALRQRLAQAGQQRVIERFNVETMVDRTACIYRTLIVKPQAVA